MIKEDIKFKKYPKIRQLGHKENDGILDGELCIEEKIDGGNHRFMFKGKRIIFGSRTQQLTSNEGEDSNVGKNFRRCIGFIRETVENSKKQGLKGLMFYGENCIKHSYEYDWDKIPPFLGFDVYDLKKEQFIDVSKKHLLFKRLGLPSIESVVGIWGKDLKIGRAHV